MAAIRTVNDGDALLGKIDTEAEPELAAAARNRLHPDPDRRPRRRAGLLPARRTRGAALTQAIDAVRDLDMDEVHAKVAAQSAA